MGQGKGGIRLLGKGLGETQLLNFWEINCNININLYFSNSFYLHDSNI